MSKGTPPLVSIGIPFYNSERYIIATLESVKAQTYSNIELILIDDCSPDNSRTLVEEWIATNKGHFSNVAVLTNEINRGVAFSCRALQQKAGGKYFTKLDADDIIFPDKISHQAGYLEANPAVAMVYSNTIRIDADGYQLPEDYFAHQNFASVVNNCGPSGHIFNKLLKEDFIPASSVLIRKSALENVGGYDENLWAEDWDMWLRIAKQYEIQFLPGYFSQYRIHPQSTMQKRESLVRVYDSLITALLKHANLSKELDEIIAKHLYTYAVGLYRFGVINKAAMKKNFMYNKNLKSFAYYLLSLLNIKIHQK